MFSLRGTMSHAAQLIREDLERVTASIWEKMLELQIHEVDEMPERQPLDVWLGSIELSGAFNGEVILITSTALAERARGRIYEGARFELTEEETEDVLRELVNITGGNLKNVVPEPTEISLPTVHKTTWVRAQAAVRDVALRLSFVSNEEPYLIYVIRKD
jgi:chemotaxis protein CheX